MGSGCHRLDVSFDYDDIRAHHAGRISIADSRVFADDRLELQVGPASPSRHDPSYGSEPISVGGDVRKGSTAVVALSFSHVRSSPDERTFTR